MAFDTVSRFPVGTLDKVVEPTKFHMSCVTSVEIGAQ